MPSCWSHIPLHSWLLLCFYIILDLPPQQYCSNHRNSYVFIIIDSQEAVYCGMLAKDSGGNILTWLMHKVNCWISFLHSSEVCNNALVDQSPPQLIVVFLSFLPPKHPFQIPILASKYLHIDCIFFVKVWSTAESDGDSDGQEVSG